jgi:hypothetical protein
MGNYWSRGDEPIRCVICKNLTNGYICNGHMLCAFCNKKFEHIPEHIPINLWGKYVKIER